MSHNVGPSYRLKGTLSTVEQAARALEFIARQERNVGLSEIAEQLNLAKSSAHRILKTWTGLGYLEQDDDARYRLGQKLFEIMFQHVENRDLRLVARPFLQGVSDLLGETVHFTVLDRYEVVYVDKIEGRQPIRVYTTIGGRGPVHATASGKAMLAYQPDDYLDGLIASSPARFTRFTLTEPNALRVACDEIRANGHAVNRREWHEEVAAVGVPVFDHNREVQAALSVTFPSVYFDESRVRELAAALMEAGQACSRRLGYVTAERDDYPE